jgi:hypothetical protein
MTNPCSPCAWFPFKLVCLIVHGMPEQAQGTKVPLNCSELVRVHNDQSLLSFLLRLQLHALHQPKEESSDL